MDVLHRCREDAKSAFFQEIGYVFDNWKKITSDVCQSSLELSCLSDVVQDMKWEDVSDGISDTIEGQTFEQIPIESGGDVYERMNIEVLSAAREKLRLLFIVVKHDVDVSLTLPSRGNKLEEDVERKKIDRQLHLLIFIFWTLQKTSKR